MICIDLENTVIDDLENCNLMHKNINDICNAIKVFDWDVSSLLIYTWGWFNQKEIDKGVIETIVEEFRKRDVKVDFVKTITKKDTIKEHIDMGKFFWDGEIDGMCECSFNEQFNKESAFRNICRKGSLKEIKDLIVFDDSFEEDVDMNFRNQRILFLKVG